jgi:hypothetical protein
MNSKSQLNAFVIQKYECVTLYIAKFEELKIIARGKLLVYVKQPPPWMTIAKKEISESGFSKDIQIR